MDKKQLKLRELRQRAESALENTHTSGSLNLKPIDELIHEMKVYHVELELQNEELRATQKALTQSHKEFEDLFDNAPLTYLIMNTAGIILRANLTATKQFGISRKRLEGRPLFELIAPEDQDKYYLHQRRLIHTQQTQTSDILMLMQDNSRFYGRIQSTLNYSADKKLTFRVTISDISQQKMFEKRLQSLRELDQAMLRSPSLDNIVEVALHYLITLTSCLQASILIFVPKSRTTYVFSQTQAQEEIKQYELKKDKIQETYIPREYRILPMLENETIGEQTLLTVPIIHSGTHMGSVWLYANAPQDFDEQVILLGEEISRQLGIAIQQNNLFNQLQDHANELEERVEKRTHELHEREQSEHIQRIFAEAMLDIARGLNSTLDLNEVLERILLNLERVIFFDAANVMLLQDGIGKIIRWRGKHAFELEKLNNTQMIVSEIPAYKYVIKSQESLFIGNDEESSLDAWGDFYQRAYAYVGLPIRSDETTHGILNIYLPPKTSLSTQQLERLEAFAEHAAIAVSNARLHQTEQHLAVMEERQRLARDLHDAVSQSLFSLRIMAETLTEKVSAGNNPQLNILENIVDLASGAQAEMRLLLMELRPAAFTEAQLDDLIEKLVLSFKGRKQREIRTQIDDELPTLSNEVKMHLYRITQEALNNVIKHAESGDVEICLQQNDGHLILSVKDTGQGFNLEDASRMSHGLSIMRERAQEIGATLTIHSEPGAGTEVKVLLSLS